jgi:Dolichyl-phosphate-mannose-protein mannosyltransferase
MADDPALLSERDRNMTRIGWVVAAALLLTHVVLAWMVRSPAISTGNDDALYLLLARSIRSLSYLDSHIVGAPVHAQYPPGYPAFLALFGESFQGALAGGIVVSAIGLILTYDLARRLLSPALALLLLAVLAVNPALLNYAGSLRSETLFMMTSVAAIWCAYRPVPTTGWLVAAGFFAIYSAMVRTAGVAMVASLGLIWLMQRRYRAAVIFSAVAVVVVGGWLYWTSVAPDQFYSRSYAAAFRRAESAPTAIGVLINRVEASAIYLYRSIPASLAAPSVPGVSIDNVVWILLLGGGLLAGLLVMWKRVPLLSSNLILYGLILTLYPFKLTRFVVPVLPFLVLLIAGGWTGLVQRWGPRGQLIAGALVLLPLIGGGVARDLTMIRHSQACYGGDPRAPAKCSSREQVSFFRAARYAMDSMPAEARFLTLKEATFAWLSGRTVQHPERAIRRDTLNLPGTLRRSGVDYVVITPLHHSRLNRFLLRGCREFAVIRRFPQDTYILQVLPAPDSAPGQVCEDLTRLSGDPRFEVLEDKVP